MVIFNVIFIKKGNAIMCVKLQPFLKNKLTILTRIDLPVVFLSFH